MVGELLEGVEDGRHLLQHLVEIAFVALQPRGQRAEGAIRVDELGFELCLVRGRQVEQTGAVGDVATECLVLGRHHLRDPVELDVEGAELLILCRDLAGDGRGVLQDAGHRLEEEIEIRATVSERGATFPRQRLDSRTGLRIEEVHHLVEVDGGGGVLQRQRAARGDGSGAGRAGR